MARAHSQISELERVQISRPLDSVWPLYLLEHLDFRSDIRKVKILLQRFCHELIHVHVDKPDLLELWQGLGLARIELLVVHLEHASVERANKRLLGVGSTSLTVAYEDQVVTADQGCKQGLKIALDDLRQPRLLSASQNVLVDRNDPVGVNQKQLRV